MTTTEDATSRQRLPVGRLARTMRPEQYEYRVAAVLRSEGWQTTITWLSRDMGDDVLAKRTGQRMAVQEKLYGASST